MSNDSSQPSQISGAAKATQGELYKAIASITPVGLGSSDWQQSGEALAREGKAEVEEAKRAAATEAAVEGAQAKAKSAWGMVTGDQKLQSEGNLENEGAQWKYKQATSEGLVSAPVPSAEGMKGKIESVVGMVTGDQQKQNEGNLRAEKASWKDGV